jgi:hypothetical protein
MAGLFGLKSSKAAGMTLSSKNLQKSCRVMTMIKTRFLLG